MNIRKSVAIAAAGAIAVVGLGAGGAVADKMIGSKHLKQDAVKSKHIKNGTIKGKDLNEKLQDRIKASGEKGPQGEQGEQGPQGEQGEQGVPGEQGEAGLNGADGQDGVDGQDGADGTDGLTGYYVTNGTRVVPANSTLTYTRPCWRADSYVLGGGVTTNAGTDPGLNNDPTAHDVIVMESGPATDAGANHPAMSTLEDGRALSAGWKVTVRNNDDHPHAVLIWATCATMADVPSQPWPGAN